MTAGELMFAQIVAALMALGKRVTPPEPQPRGRKPKAQASGSL